MYAFETPPDDDWMTKIFTEPVASSSQSLAEGAVIGVINPQIESASRSATTLSPRRFAVADSNPADLFPMPGDKIKPARMPKHSLPSPPDVNARDSTSARSNAKRELVSALKPYRSVAITAVVSIIAGFTLGQSRSIPDPIQPATTTQVDPFRHAEPGHSDKAFVVNPSDQAKTIDSGSPVEPNKPNTIAGVEPEKPKGQPVADQPVRPDNPFESVKFTFPMVEPAQSALSLVRPYKSPFTTLRDALRASETGSATGNSTPPISSEEFNNLRKNLLGY